MTDFQYAFLVKSELERRADNGFYNYISYERNWQKWGNPAKPSIDTQVYTKNFISFSSELHKALMLCNALAVFCAAFIASITMPALANFS